MTAALRVPAERRRRADLVVAALIGTVAVIGALLVLRAGDEAATSDTTAVRPIDAPPDGGVPTALVEAWRAASPATPAPLVAGPAVATVGPTPDGGGVVAGRDARTGAVAWEYVRPEPPCTAAAGFGDVLAVFRTAGPLGVWCSDVAALQPATGVRGPARHADLREGTRLVADRSTHVVGVGPHYLEVWRDDLVLTSEIGDVPAPVQPPSAQPRANCTNASVTAGAGRVAVTQRCPGEDSDRLTVYDADPESHEKPEERLSTLTGARPARVVAVADDRTAWVGPDGRLHVVDGSGAEVNAVPLGPAAGPAVDPPGLVTRLREAGPVRLWWTGTSTVALDPDTLLPRWSRPGTLGAGTVVPGPSAAPVVLVPVPAGFDVLDAATGVPRGPVVPVDRGPVPAPVEVAALGTVVLEQRGPTLVALVPPRRWPPPGEAD